MRPLRTFGLALTTLALLAPAAARADVSPDNAQALEQQLHDWLNGMVGSLVGIPDRPVQITAEDDHYRVEIPLSDVLDSFGLQTNDDATITADARPLSGDRWAIDEVHLPNLEARMPGGKSGKGIDWTMSFADQHIKAVIDPSFATASTFDTEITGRTTTTEGTAQPSASAVEHMTGHSVWMPTGDGRVDMIANSTLDKVEGSQIMPDGTPVTWSMDSIQNNVRVNNVALGSLGDIVREAVQLAPVLAAASQSRHLPPEARQTARDLVQQLRSLLGGFESSETIQGMRFETATARGSIEKIAVGLSGGAKDGKLDLHLRLAVDGFDSPDLPAGPMHDYLPRHIALDPHLSGVPAEAASQLLLQAIDSDDANPDQLGEQATALLKQSPVSIGMDDLDIDLGPARLHGSGAVRIAAADDVSGNAKITITGMDALIKEAGRLPQLKGALPVLLMLKGLGRQQGDLTTWVVRYSGNSVMVNGNDLSGLLGNRK